MNMLALFSIFPSGSDGLAWWILAAIGVIGLVIAYFKFDDRREERRKRAAKAADACSDIGDDLLAGLLRDYAVGDFSGMTRTVREIIDKLLDRDGEGPVAMRANLVKKILPEIAKDPVHGPSVREVVKQVYGTKAKVKPVVDEEGEAAGSTVTA